MGHCFSEGVIELLMGYFDLLKIYNMECHLDLLMYGGYPMIIVSIKCWAEPQKIPILEWMSHKRDTSLVKEFLMGTMVKEQIRLWTHFACNGEWNKRFVHVFYDICISWNYHKVFVHRFQKMHVGMDVPFSEEIVWLLMGTIDLL